MERSGSGFEKIKDTYKSYNERFEPKVTSNIGTFSITLMDLTYQQEYKEIISSARDNVPLNGTLNGTLNDALFELYYVIKNNPGINRKGLAEETGKSESTLGKQIMELVNKNFIKRVGSGKTGGYVIIE